MYKDALSHAKQAYGTGAYDDGTLEAIFPELAESDDERIRQWLVNYFKEVGKSWIHRDITCEQILEWLEKQKEHQSCPDAPKEKKLGGDFYSSDKDKNLDEIAQDYVDGVKEYNPEPTWDLMQTAVCYGYRLSEELFEKNRLANCDALSKEEYDRETDFAMEIIEKEHRHPTFNDAINYGMRLQKKQKPVEWKPQPESLEALMYAIEGEWEKIKPTSYLSRRLEDLYEGLVNTYNVDESLLAELPKAASRAYTAEGIEELRELKRKIEASMELK